LPAGRLLVPYVPLLAVAVSLGWARLLVRARRGGTGVLSLLLLVSAPLGLAFQWSDRLRLVEQTDDATAISRTSTAPLGEWLRDHATAGDAVATVYVGQLGYRCFEQRILDLGGRTDRHIGQHPGSGTDKQFDLSYVWDQRPRFIAFALSAHGGTDAPL